MGFPNWVVKAYPTNLPSLDRVLGGLRPCELIVLASVDRHASSTLALQFAATLAKQRVLTGLFGRGVFTREANRYLDPLNEETTMIVPLIIETPANTIAQFGQMLAQIVIRQGIRIAICGDIDKIDEHQPLPQQWDTAMGDDTWEDDSTLAAIMPVSAVSRTMKSWAMRYHLPIIGTYELSPRQAGRTIREPRLGDLGEDGTWECDADVVVFIHGQSIEQELIVAKNRNGPTGRIPMIYDHHRGFFHDWDEDAQG